MTGEGSLFDVPPAAIGRFRVLHQIGAGTCGPVFRAVDPEGDAPVAIKLITSTLTPDRSRIVVDRLTTLVDETPRSTAAVALVEAGLHASHPYLVMALAPGDSLDVALKQFGPAILADLLPRLGGLARALDACAERGLVHGALHPRDVLVSEADTVLTGVGIWPILIDAGVRLPIRRPYRAPEVAEGVLDAAGDRFAFAALSYEWLTGRRVTLGAGFLDLPAIDGLDREPVVALFERALHDDSDERFPTAQAFVDELTSLTAGLDALGSVARTRTRRKSRSAGPLLPLDLMQGDAADDAQHSSSLEEFASDDEVEGPVDVVVAEPVEDSRLEWDVPLDTPHAAGSDGGADERVWTLGDESDSGDGAPVEPELEPEPADEVEVPAVYVAPESASEPGRFGSLALGLALLLGVGLGLGTGYVMWGRQAPAASAIGGGATGGTATGAPQSTEIVEPPLVPPSEDVRNAPAAAPAPPPASSPAPGEGAQGTARPADTGAARPATPTPASAASEEPVRTAPAPVAPRSVPAPARPAAAAPAATRPTPAPAAPAARTGSLLVDSRPIGATVRLNGRVVGVTPVTLEDLAPGVYNVNLQLEGFLPLTTTVRVVAGERARAAASLTSAQENQ